MKKFKLFAMLFMMVAFAFTSCKNEGTAATDDTRESLATTSTTEQATGEVSNKPASTPAAPVGPLTSLEFTESVFDFGEVMEGEKVVHNYTFTNTGKEPLIISNAKGSCGCTVPSWPREPIPPGESGDIKVQFDSKGKGKVGGNNQSKRVTLTANTDPAQTFLTIKGKVNKEEVAAPAK